MATELQLPKQALYKTAIATVSCKLFKAGEVVNVDYSHRDKDGLDWYLIEFSQRGELPHSVAYPDVHLTDFCL